MGSNGCFIWITSVIFHAFIITSCTRDHGLQIHANKSDNGLMTRLNLSSIMLSDFGDDDNGNNTGPPETPRELKVSHVTSDAALLSWTSGYDMGSQQYFFVMEGIGGGNFIQMSDRINDTSSSHGINATFTYQMQGLYSDTLYNISVVALNDKGGVLAKPVAFTTKDPNKHTDGHGQFSNKYGIFLVLVGAVLLLFSGAWLFKRRRDRRSKERFHLLHKQYPSDG